jgi:hypothetical protein
MMAFSLPIECAILRFSVGRIETSMQVPARVQDAVQFSVHENLKRYTASTAVASNGKENPKVFSKYCRMFCTSWRNDTE